MRLDSPHEHVLKEIYDTYSFEVPGARFMKTYKARKWNGTIHLLNYRTRLIYTGLTNTIIKFARERNYSIELRDFPEKSKFVIPQSDFILSDGNGNKIEMHDHQKTAHQFICQHSRGIILSPTASGKSLIIYSTIRERLKVINGKILIIVITTSLVEQLYKDFEDYSQFDNTWNNDEMVHRIYQGKEKFDFDKRVVISTYQSIVRLDHEYFSQFDMVICDECHAAKSHSIISIMQNLKNAEYRYGFTGTLQDTQVHLLVLTGLFGKTFKTASTQELIDQKKIANLSINAIILRYNDEQSKASKKFTYNDEIDFIISNQKRNNFICNLAESLTGNTLILYSYVEKHGNVLKELLDVKSKKDIHYIHGKIDTLSREEMRQITEKNNNVIILGSFSILSTGINIKNLHNIIFASPSKSKIRILQSIGRSLRLNSNKSGATIYDICDDMHYLKSHTNYSLDHFIERLKLYQHEEFDYKIHKINF